jgi:hypothetical protein
MPDEIPDGAWRPPGDGRTNARPIRPQQEHYPRHLLPARAEIAPASGDLRARSVVARRRVEQAHDHEMKEHEMGFLRGALKTAMAAKVIDVVRREATKPENQRRAKELMDKAKNRKGSGRRGY